MKNSLLQAVGITFSLSLTLTMQLDVDDSLQHFLRRLDTAAILDVSDACLQPHASFAELYDSSGVEKRRHRMQESQLLRAAQNTLGNGLENCARVVEFGAGHGDFALHFARARKWSNLNLPAFLLLDRQTFRSQSRRDGALRKLGCVVDRVVRDVREWPLESDVGEGSCLFCAKHFCGCAADEMLRLFVGWKKRPAWLVAATCCHALIERDLMADKAVALLEEDWGLNIPDLKKVSGWATLNGLEDPVRKEKQRLGAKAKRVIDTARIAAVKAALPEAHINLVCYTSESVECNAITCSLISPQ